MRNEDLRIWLAVISQGRPHAVPEMVERLGQDATWYVGKGEYRDYRNAGAKRVVEGGILPISRNLALDDAWQRGLTCVQISDDLRRFSLATERMVKLNALSASMLVLSAMSQFPDIQAGSVSSNSNPYMSIGYRSGKSIDSMPYMQRPLISFKSLILGDFTVAKRCGIYFDENTLVKEDYEYTLRHLVAFGRVLRCNYILSDFRHRTNKGGAHFQREFGAEKQSFKYLLRRWPKVLSTNTKHGPTSSPYELLIRWKPEEKPNLPPARYPRLPEVK